MSLYQHISGEIREIAADLMAAWLAASNPKADGWTAYTPPPPEPEVPQVPQSVTMRQARLALLGAGVLSQVEGAINAMPEPQKSAARITWEYSAEVQRHNGLVSQMAPALGLTSAQIDALFIAAAQIP
jgi:hypothetical protein